MKTSFPADWIMVVALTLGACSKSPQGPVVDQARSDLARDLDPQVLQADAGALIEGNTAFAADLFRAVRGPENLMVSPHSISLALAMTWAGAQGETATAMAQALQFRLPQERLAPAFDQLDLALASRGQNAQGKDGEPFRLKISNAAWGQEDFEFVPAYLDVLAKYYGAGIYLLDFATALEAARGTINDWVAWETENRIQNLLEEGVLKSDTRLVLTNTVYFNAAWKTKFDRAATRDAPFTLSDGTQVAVPTLFGDGVEGAYAEGPGWRAAELPYDGGETSMVVVLPESATLEAFATGLDGAKLQAIAGGLQAASLRVSMPKFRFESKAELEPALTALGMAVAFSDLADFAGIHAEGGIRIANVIHQTFVALDENGTEAAAATAVVIGPTSAPPAGIEVKIDRPFLFFIRDVETGAILFLGQVVDPR